jgi:hypothetical protein
LENNTQRIAEVVDQQRVNTVTVNPN